VFGPYDAFTTENLRIIVLVVLLSFDYFDPSKPTS
jgi:hypothetical protein